MKKLRTSCGVLKPTERHDTYFIHRFIQYLSIQTDDGDDDTKIYLTGKVPLRDPSALVLLYHSCHRLCRAHQPRRCLKWPPNLCPLLEPMELVPGSGGHSRPLRTLAQKWPHPDTRSSQRSRGVRVLLINCSRMK